MQEEEKQILMTFNKMVDNNVKGKDNLFSL